MPRKLDHIALVVRDPARTATLFSTVFDDVEVEAGKHDTRVCMGGVCLVLVAGQPPAAANGDHIAFAVTADEFRSCERRLRRLDRDVQLARGDSALYFRDDDNHVFELDLVDDG